MLGSLWSKRGCCYCPAAHPCFATCCFLFSPKVHGVTQVVQPLAAASKCHVGVFVHGVGTD